MVQPRKCCPQPLSLDTSDRTYPQCVRAQSSSLDLGVDTNIPARLPNCKAEYEVHFMESEDTQHAPSNTWIDDDGVLITGKYGEDFRIKDFCVDLDVDSGTGGS